MAAAAIASGTPELAGGAAAAEPSRGVGLTTAAVGTARGTTVPLGPAAGVESLLVAAVDLSLDLSLDPSPDLVLDLLFPSDLPVLVSPDCAPPLAPALPAPVPLAELVLAPAGGEPAPALLVAADEGA
jgi:hypothetical protein